ncbi:PHP domain-containing protein [Acidobacteriota bacterium]
MSESVDLHIHSNKSSDGEYPPHEIVLLAKQMDLRAISIADHDSVAAYPEALLEGEKAGIEVIPSVELTTRFDQREFHLLLPFVEWSHEIVIELVAEVARKRTNEAKARVEKLQKIGMDVRWEDVEMESGRFPPVGVTIALALLKRAKNKGDPIFKKYYDAKQDLFAPLRFYEDYLMQGRKAAVPRQNLSLEYVLQTAAKTGAVPVLSHPGAYFMQADKGDLSYLKEKGLEGIEVYTSYHNPRKTKKYKKIAEDLDLVPTAGSDFHGIMKPQVSFACISEGKYWMVEKLRERQKH